MQRPPKPPQRGCHPERTGPQALFGVPKERSCSFGAEPGGGESKDLRLLFKSLGDKIPWVRPNKLPIAALKGRAFRCATTPPPKTQKDRARGASRVHTPSSFRKADLSLPMTQAKIKHYLLRPLGRRKTLIANQKAIVSALEQLDDRALGNAVLPAATKSANSSRKDRGQGFYKNPGYVQKQVLLSKALYLSGRISRSQYVVFASMPVETLNEEQLFDGKLENELHEIKEQIDSLDKESGLPPDHYWPKGQAPEEFQNRYNSLETHYSAVIAKSLHRRSEGVRAG